ncbi:2-keto-3-deoxy-D-arabino-heptulosonate-7-phosphate synthase I beta [hydrothermal vent metagenome]|uniref:2-keto-3-deoxy-D-arabino-heptulosonate-7-phosphate synthase I beta n=1 Tax=hydrothermal vent metagenome TaxID=652676 RepID=A0A3B1DJM2_9ZZZZ
MIIVLKPGTSKEERERIVGTIEDAGLSPHVLIGKERTVIAVIGDERKLRQQTLSAIPGVEKALPILSPYKLVSREFKKEDTIIDVDGVKIGGGQVVMMAGPCSVETQDLLSGIASEVKAAGASILRGGAFKPRTSPYSFQGLGEEGLKFLAAAKKQTGLPVITEIMDPRDMPMIIKHADIIQIGARNMQNFRLLSEAGKQNKPVMLKRGLSATIKEFLLSAEYILSEGNDQVMLCERGIRTFETATRNTLDLSAIPVLKKLTHLPIIVDPSHAVGKTSLIPAMAKAAIAAGADGLMIEVHSNPMEAFCDGDQAMLPHDFKSLVVDLKRVAAAVDRSI